MSTANEMLAQNRFRKVADLASLTTMIKHLWDTPDGHQCSKKSNLIGEDILSCVERNLT